MKVTFFGHRDAPGYLNENLYAMIEHLIVERNADTFYVGDHGNFDRMVLVTLEKIRRNYPDVKCCVVLSKMPTAQNHPGALETLFPEEVAIAHYKNAINKRNMWMLSHSDIVVTYVRRSYGGAARFRDIAIRQGKCIMDL